jgi:hypothetical protein
MNVIRHLTKDERDQPVQNRQHRSTNSEEITPINEVRRDESDQQFQRKDDCQNLLFQLSCGLPLRHKLSATIKSSLPCRLGFSRFSTVELLGELFGVAKE